MTQQPPPRWIKETPPIFEFMPMMRYSGAGGTFESMPTTSEAGCLDAPEILSGGAMRRHIAATGEIGWPRQSVCAR